jgi:hypothetical protein
VSKGYRRAQGARARRKSRRNAIIEHNIRAREGDIVRREIIKSQKLSSRVIAGLQEMAHKQNNKIAYLLQDGMNIADISRTIHKKYDHVWTEARKLLSTAVSVTLQIIETIEGNHCTEILELFADAQDSVPDHAKRSS